MCILYFLSLFLFAIEHISTYVSNYVHVCDMFFEG